MKRMRMILAALLAPPKQQRERQENFRPRRGPDPRDAGAALHQPWITLLAKNVIDVLVLNFNAMFSARVKVKKKDLCIVLARKQQRCRHRAPLKEFHFLPNMAIDIFALLIQGWLWANGIVNILGWLNGVNFTLRCKVIN